MIDGYTTLIAHIGYPTTTFKSPMIYNPYFEKQGINAAVVPMGVKAEDLDRLLRPLMGMANVHGALVTMPLKVKIVTMLDEVSTAVKVAGSCNAVLKRKDGTLVGDNFDGEGFVRAVRRHNIDPAGKDIFILGTGGVGSAIAASFAGAGVGTISLFDIDKKMLGGLAERLRKHYPKTEIKTDSGDPAGHDIVVNATPVGMNAEDPMPIDVARISPGSLVSDVVLKSEMTKFLAAAKAKGCKVQIGTDMLFEMIPAYLEFFGFPTTTSDELRAVAKIKY